LKDTTPRRLGVLLILLASLLLTGCITVNVPLAPQADQHLHATRIKGHGSAKILWLPISGFISAHPAHHFFGLAHSESTLTQVTRALDKARQDSDIAAVVLRIDSPGGTVAASDEIYHRIKRYHLETGVPVIASLGGITTSGAYYVAMSAERLIAGPTTITGSIGVIIMDVSAAKLLHRIGIVDTSIRSGPHKDSLSPLHRPTEADRQIVQSVVDGLFQRFVAVVETNRPHLDRQHLDKITDGRIFDAWQARRLGLVDAIGHQDDALDAARRAAGVKQAQIIRYYRGQQKPDTLTPTARTSAVSPEALARWLTALGQTDRRDGLQPLYLWRGGID
jgi:protease-4